MTGEKLTPFEARVSCLRTQAQVACRAINMMRLHAEAAGLGDSPVCDSLLAQAEDAIRHARRLFNERARMARNRGEA